MENIVTTVKINHVEQNNANRIKQLILFHFIRFYPKNDLAKQQKHWCQTMAVCLDLNHTPQFSLKKKIIK